MLKRLVAFLIPIHNQEDKFYFNYQFNNQLHNNFFAVSQNLILLFKMRYNSIDKDQHQNLLIQKATCNVFKDFLKATLFDRLRLSISEKVPKAMLI